MFMPSIISQSLFEIELSRHFPDNLQIHSDHTQIAPPLECFPPLASDGLILVICRCSEAHSANFVVIQTHPSRRFYLAVKFLGLRRNGSSS